MACPLASGRPERHLWTAAIGPLPGDLGYRVDMDWPVTYARKVRYSDTDAQGIVFNANFARYFDDTLTDFFEEVGDPLDGIEVVLGRLEIDFRSPARLGETIVTGARVDRIGNTSITVSLATWEADSGRLVVEGRQVQVTVSASDWRPVPVPNSLADAIGRFQGGFGADEEATS